MEAKMPGKIRVGVIGVGYLGGYHAEKYAALAEVELMGVADVIPARAQQVAHRVNTRDYTDYRDLLPLVDAVSVAVPTLEHYGVVRDCLEAGVQVLVEKPLAATVAQARDLVALARSRGLLLMVGHLERFSAAMAELRQQVTKPRFIESHRLGFFKQRGTDVDVVLDLMIHDLDHILSLVKAPVQEIRAAGVCVLTDNIDLANARLEFADGCIANLTASRMSLKSMRRFRLFQPEAYLAVDLETQELTIAARRPGAVSPIPGVALDIRRYPQEDALLKEIKAFVTAVREGQESPVSGEAGLAALTLAFEIKAAMQVARG